MTASEPLEVLIGDVQGCFACDGMVHCHTLSEANGTVSAHILFVGEAPGRFGAGRSGVPFQGDESGRRFDVLLSAAGLNRKDVFITNAVLCNPLDKSGRNRRPRVSDVDRCASFLRRQIEVVSPRIVVALGGVALDALGRIQPHGLSLRDAAQPCDWFSRLLVPLYHPGRRALVHRGEAQQFDDWRRLGELASTLASDAEPLNRWPAALRT